MTRSAKEQLTPLFLTVVTFFLLCLILFGFIHILNLFPIQKVTLTLRVTDILVGFTIYLKTSIDFAIFIGNLMKKNQGVKHRIAIEIGTALGNSAGTLAVLCVWYFFKEVPLLMAVMIILAGFVLLQMAEESLVQLFGKKIPVLSFVNSYSEKLLGKIIPNLKISNVKSMNFTTLLVFSFTIPFILGLDDFAGYIPLFSIVNVFGFAIGVFFGHMLLNLALFLNPAKTVVIVKHPIVLFFGGIAFVGIALWGFFEAFRLIVSLVH